MLGVRLDGTKELIALAEGLRESTACAPGGTAPKVLIHNTRNEQRSPPSSRRASLTTLDHCSTVLA